MAIMQLILFIFSLVLMIVYRDLLHADNDAILELESHSAPDMPDYRWYRQPALDYLFANPDKCRVMGAFDNDRIVAWCAYRTGREESYESKEGTYEISTIVVDKAYRDQDIGTEVFKRVITSAKEQDCKQLYLTVYPGNVGAMIFFLKQGFEVYDFRADLYGPGADRVFLEWRGKIKL